MRLLPFLLLAACGMPTGNTYRTDPLWSPDTVRAETGAVYAPLIEGRLAYITPDGIAQQVELSGGVVAALQPLPDGSGVATFIDRTFCIEDGDDDCADTRVERSVGIVEQGAITREAVVGRHLNALAFSPAGSRAIAWLDGPPPEGPIGVVNLGEVDIVDLDDGSRTPVRVGFAADTILFTEDGTSAVVLSQSQVALVDLTASPPRVDVTFPLTLDPDVNVRPVGAALTPDGRYALIATENSGDLYVLDLVDPSVNLISLPSNPSDLHVEASTDETLFVFRNSSVLAILDHERFELRTLPLDEPASRILTSEDHAVLWSDSNLQDVYRYRYDEKELTEYRLLAPADDIRMAPDGNFAVALTQPNSTGRYGMEIVDLRGERGDTYVYGLDGQGVGVSFTQGGDGSTWALVLQSGVDTVWRGELSTGIAQTFELTDSPSAIGDLGDGRFFIAHNEPLGLISFYDPTDDSVVEASGFALLDALDDRETTLEAP